MLLAIDPDIIFFLLVAVIGLINQLYKKSKELREAAIRKQKRREGQDRLVIEPSPEPAFAPEPVAPVLPPKPKTSRARSMLQERVTRRRKAEKKIARRAPVKAATPTTGFTLDKLRGNPNALREAVILREILGPPISLRNSRRFR